MKIQATHGKLPGTGMDKDLVHTAVANPTSSWVGLISCSTLYCLPRNILPTTGLALPGANIHCWAVVSAGSCLNSQVGVNTSYVTLETLRSQRRGPAQATPCYVGCSTRFVLTFSIKGIRTAYINYWKLLQQEIGAEL